MNAQLVLGLNLGHDSGAAAVTVDSAGRRLIAHCNEERFDRRKNSAAFPYLASAACLAELGAAEAHDADLVVFDGQSAHTAAWLDRIAPAKRLSLEHHACHAAASFFTSPFERAAVLVVDSRGHSLWTGQGRQLRLLVRADGPGIGTRYEAMTRRIGFGPLEAGKTMGLAPFGREQGGLGGAAHDEASPGGTVLEAARLAQAIQADCVRTMLELAAWARRESGEAHLCLGGGVALNGAANHAILRARIVDGLFINPACSDAGAALGAALWGWHMVLGAPRAAGHVSPYTGPGYPPARMEAALARLPVDGRCVLQRTGALEKAARLLADGRSVALFHGRSEMGPRALGHRSILMSPFSAAARAHLNLRVKRREAFRPFAPVLRLEDAERFFELGAASPFMLYVCPVRPAWRQKLAAVTHVDGSARPQTVADGENAPLRALLDLFGQHTGLPVLLNTSFNVAGEPLVESPEDAVRCLLGCELDALLLAEVLIEKRR